MFYSNYSCRAFNFKNNTTLRFSEERRRRLGVASEEFVKDAAARIKAETGKEEVSLQEVRKRTQLSDNAIVDAIANTRDRTIAPEIWPK